MRIGKIEVKRRVWIGLGFALGVTAAWWGWTQAKRPLAAAGPVTPPVKQPLVRLAGVGATGDQALRERAALFDPTPLFFPTEWNYGQRPLREGIQRQPGQVFGSFAPRFLTAEQEIATYGIEASPAPEKLSDVLVQGNEAPFAGMGQVDVPRSPLPVRSGYLEIRDLSGAENNIHQMLSGFSLPRSDFPPVEFLVVVGKEGLVGDLTLMSGSGWDEVDAFFRSYLVNSYHLGVRLRPGRYRVLVGA